MKLHLARPDGQNMLTGYGPGYLQVNEQRLHCNLIVTPQRLVENWTTGDVSQLADAQFEKLRELGAEIILLGSGATLRFPPHAFMRSLAQVRIGLEVMDSGAACRTYNILMAEGRNVAAALLLP